MSLYDDIKETPEERIDREKRFRALREMQFSMPIRCDHERYQGGMRCENKAEFILFRIHDGEPTHVCDLCVGDAVRLATRRGPVTVERMA